jgi:hypothetical protein
MKCARLVARAREVWVACTILIGKSEDKKRIGITRHSWEDSIKMVPNDQGYEVMV